MSEVSNTPSMQMHHSVFPLVSIPWNVRRRRARFLRPLRWQYDYELVEGYRAPWAADIPTWAQSPTAGIVGTWRATRRRLTLFHIPVWGWRGL